MHQDIIRSVDWDRVSRMTDEAIAEDRARDPDAMPFTDADGVALRVQLIRKGLSLSQAQFAAQFHIPLATLKDWEQGRRQPGAAAWPILRVIEGGCRLLWAEPLKQPKSRQVGASVESKFQRMPSRLASAWNWPELTKPASW